MTCCVTAEAERKSRQLVNRLAAGGRPVVVTGCAAAYRPEQFVAPGAVVAARSDVGAAVRELAGRRRTGGGGRRRGAMGAAAPAGVADVGAAGGAPGRRARRPRTRLHPEGAGRLLVLLRLLRRPPGARAAVEPAPRAGRGSGPRRPCRRLRRGGAERHQSGPLSGPRRRRPGGAGRRPLRSARAAASAALVARAGAPAGAAAARRSRIPRWRATCTCRCSRPTTPCWRPCGVRTTSRSTGGVWRPCARVLGDVMISTDVIVGFPGESEAAFAARWRPSAPRPASSGACTCSRTRAGPARPRRSCRRCRRPRCGGGGRRPWKPLPPPAPLPPPPRSARRRRCSSRTASAASGAGTPRSTHAALSAATRARARLRASPSRSLFEDGVRGVVA